MRALSLFSSIIWLSSYCYLSLSNKTLEKSAQLALTGELIEETYITETRRSRLGNDYDAIIPATSLQKLIDIVKIQFSDAIPETEYAELIEAIKEGLSQRINHELLSRVLLSPNFSVKVIAFDEFNLFVKLQGSIGGSYDPKSNTIYLNHLIF